MARPKIQIDTQMMGKRIRLLRGKESQKQLGEILDFSQTTISQIELGDIRPSLEFLCNFCAYKNMPLEFVLFGSREIPFVDEETKRNIKFLIRKLETLLGKI